MQKVHAISEQRRIAVVDDDPGMRTGLRRLLSAYGYRVDTFASAADFLDSARTWEPHCLLLDIQLGDRSGLELANELAAIGYRRPIVLMTGGENEDIRKRCREFGCVAFLQKPFLASKLLDVVAAASSAQTDTGVTA